jgi:RNA polymerase sigma factor (sigma-70 family)
MEQARVPTSEQLMAEMVWIRRLARALVKNEALADDVAQETWLVANEQRPAEDRPLRPWLARVVINLVRTRRRSEVRRGQREVATHVGDPVPTPAELVERVQLQRAVADEVLALEEPYRSTVLLHFVEGYSSADIARRQRIPDGTVRRRLKVALDQLREALGKRTDQPKPGWLAALVPFARSAVPTHSPASIGGVMNKVLWIVLAFIGVAALGAGAWWLRRSHDRDNPTRAGEARGASDHVAATGESSARTTIPAWIPQPGAPERRVAGRVTARGAAVGGAKVVLGLLVMGEPSAVLLMDGSQSSVIQRVAEVRSAADGSFDFGMRPAAVFVVAASDASHSPASISVANAEPQSKPDQLVLELGDCHARLSGTISDAVGGGIAKARIVVAGVSVAESEANGAYKLCLTPRDAFETPTAELRIEADGYGTMRQTVIAVGELQQDFVLVPEAVLIGRATTADGNPVAGARILAAADPTEMPHHVASNWADSDAEGRFRISGLAPGTFHLTATAQGLGTASTITVTARPTNTSQELHIELASLAHVSGHVFMNGAPVAGAIVTALNPGVRVPGRVSQADGSFALDGVPYGTATFYVHHYLVQPPMEVTIDRDVMGDVKLEVTKQASVHGHVTRSGKPVANANVIYMQAPQARLIGSPDTPKTDATGTFVMQGVPPGPGRVVAWDMVGKAFSHWQPLDVAAGEDRALELDLDASGEVQGTVVDQDGAPAPGVYVRFDITDGTDDNCETITDASGHFDCPMLLGGTYRATVAPSPGARQTFAPADGTQFETVRVPSAGVASGVRLAIKNERVAIRGVVQDDIGAPVADVHIEAIGRGASSVDFPAAMSDAQGHFEIANLAHGTYNLHAHAADGSEAELINVTAGGAPASITIARAGAIEGTLTGFATTPTVYTNTLTPDLHMGGLAMVNGNTFSRTGLAPGRYTVVAQSGSDVDGQSVDVHPGETVHVALQSRGIGTVTGTVTEFAAKTPVAGMRCDAYLSLAGQISNAPPDPSHQAFTDAAGHFTMSAPVGRVRVFCFLPSGGPLSGAGGDIDVSATATANVNVSSVRATYGSAPGDGGFLLNPLALPLTVSQVVPMGPAATAGLRPGDQVTAIDGASLEGVSPDGAMVLVANHQSGAAVTVGIEHGGVVQTVRLVTGKQQ